MWLHEDVRERGEMEEMMKGRAVGVKKGKQDKRERRRKRKKRTADSTGAEKETLCFVFITCISTFS